MTATASWPTRRGRAIRLITRNGNDLADRLAAEAAAALPVRSCVIDAEAIVCDDSGLAVFDLIRGHGRNGRAILCAFDLLEVNSEDIRAEPIEDRKRRLTGLLQLPHAARALPQHVARHITPPTDDGDRARQRRVALATLAVQP